MDEQKIRIATSIPSLKDKIQTRIIGGSDVVFWHIRFNIPLDIDTVSDKTMGVTDTSGYVMRTDITYDEDKNTIIISPLDTYEQNRYYLLKVSKKVRSKKGQNLKSQINILFKLINNQISEYKVLKKNVKVAKSRARPKDYDIKYTRSKVYSFDGKTLGSLQQDKLPIADLSMNMWIGLAGLLLAFISYFLGNLIFSIFSIGVCFIGLGHIILQLRKDTLKSLRTYNKGARKFNKSKYAEAKSYFLKAMIQDDGNEYAEYALYKVEFYLDVPKKENL